MQSLRPVRRVVELGIVGGIIPPVMYSAKYYVRKPDSSEILGTFTIAEIHEQIRDGHLTRDWDAIVATGQSYGQLRRATRWSRVGELLNDGHERNRPPEPEEGTKRHEQIPVASFACFQCGSSLRIRLPQTDVAFRCPKCRAEFRATKAGDSPQVFVVIPVMPQFTSTASDASTRRKREIPRDVLAALAALGLEQDSTFENVTATYRELVKGYHPDKVAHLGPDLRRVAEAKTKEINSAYKVLETFYAA